MPDPLPPVRHPARFVPLSAVATGEPGQAAVPVGPSNPIPCADQPIKGARPLVPDTPIVAGVGLLVDCSAAGKATFTLADTSALTLTLSPGLTLLPFAVTEVASSGMTAAFDGWVLD